MNTQERLDVALRPVDAAAYLGGSVKWLANLRYLGGGPAFQKGNGRRGSVRYPISALEKWRREHMRESTSDAEILMLSSRAVGSNEE